MDQNKDFENEIKYNKSEFVRLFALEIDSY